MKSIVLLSSGLDSSVNLYEAHAAGEVLLALTFNYGQRAANKEIEHSIMLCKDLKVSHQTVDLPFFSKWRGSSLIDHDLKVPTGREVRIDNLGQSQITAQSVWVPNRNGIFLNIAAGFAEALMADVVVPGFNIEEAATFPDNSEEYLEQLNNSLKFSTNGRIRAHCFTTRLNKKEIVKRGLELKVPFHLVWPCYFSNDSWCGICESCLRAKRAFEANGLELFK